MQQCSFNVLYLHHLIILQAFGYISSEKVTKFPGTVVQPLNDDKKATSLGSDSQSFRSVS
jgi:hypothetical protein